jgi:hypothetical protein
MRTEDRKCPGLPMDDSMPTAAVRASGEEQSGAAGRYPFPPTTIRTVPGDTGRPLRPTTLRVARFRNVDQGQVPATPQIADGREGNDAGIHPACRPLAP